MKRGFLHGPIVFFILFVLSIALPLHSAVPARPSPAHTPFVTVLLRDFDAWDTNHDGVLSVAEIDRVVLNPSVKGDDAAVAGSLKLMSRSTKAAVPALTKQYFLDYDHQALGMMRRITPAAAEAATTDTVSSAAQTPPTLTTSRPTTAPVIAAKKLPINWDLYFVAGKRRITRGGGAIWPEDMDLATMRQGPLGDCFLIATIGSMVIHRPHDVGQLMKPLNSGEYQVTFPGIEPFMIHALTQSELVLSSTTSGEGIWLAAMEQGFGKFRERQKGDIDPEGTDIIAIGGQPGATMSALTGHRFKQVYFATTAHGREMEEARMLPILRAHLVEALKDHRLITSSVTPPIISTTPTTRPTATVPTTHPSTRPILTADMLPRIPPDINTRHAYAILGYDPKTDLIEIWNPHGQSFTPKGPDGLSNGYTTLHGRFKVPVKDAYCFFTRFFFETGEPVPNATTAPVTMH